ncbi:unnamed protein product [Clonostachys rosea]|uniref:Dienelactone hydrolase domain-containing protein n=1 Tax=Bionectria ochroleuca TaxID=29856 RepID=A0ABY6TXP6_BIOOC|nr:unnamed protein product [Clonostachys rosea]
MASNPPGECCTRGWILSGEPAGELIKCADGKTDAYLATPGADFPAKKDSAILILPDIFGIYPNSQLVADSFAAQGYTTLIPDLFKGDQVPVDRPAGFDIMSWIAKGSDGNNPHTPATIDPIVAQGIETLKSLGIKRIGGVGYCFGAKYVVRNYKHGIDVGYSAHPSFVEEEELAAITGPYSISAAETDEIFPEKLRIKSEEILRKTGLPFQINLFQGVEHGFAVRGNPNVRAERFAKEQAFKQAVAWFDEFLVNP